MPQLPEVVLALPTHGIQDQPAFVVRAAEPPPALVRCDLLDLEGVVQGSIQGTPEQVLQLACWNLAGDGFWYGILVCRRDEEPVDAPDSWSATVGYVHEIEQGP